jgi:hypothetical protein
MTGAADSDEQYFLSLANWKLSAWTNTWVCSKPTTPTILCGAKYFKTVGIFWSGTLGSKMWVSRITDCRSLSHICYLPLRCFIIIGKNTIAQFGKEIALTLGWSKERASEVTVHWRAVFFFVTGELEIKCLDEYLSLFKADDTNDSLWRQVLQDSGNLWSGTLGSKMWVSRITIFWLSFSFTYMLLTIALFIS